MEGGLVCRPWENKGKDTMKTLKFMLAAATAIGLASATQADQYNTTGFEKLAVGTNVTTGVQDNRSGYSYFYYAGANA